MLLVINGLTASLYQEIIIVITQYNLRGYIIQNFDIFAPPPIFSKMIFFPQKTVKIPLFPRFSTSYSLIFAFFLSKQSYFFHNQPTHIFGNLKNIRPCKIYRKTLYFHGYN